MEFEAKTERVPLDLKVPDYRIGDPRLTQEYQSKVDQVVDRMRQDGWEPIGPLELSTRWMAGLIQAKLESSVLGKALKLIDVEIEFARGDFDFPGEVRCEQCRVPVSILDVHCPNCSAYIPEMDFEFTPGAKRRGLAHIEAFSLGESMRADLAGQAAAPRLASTVARTLGAAAPGMAGGAEREIGKDSSSDRYRLIQRVETAIRGSRVGVLR